MEIDERTLVDIKREARDDQTYVVLSALRRVLGTKTSPRLIEIIIEDVLEELHA